MDGFDLMAADAVATTSSGQGAAGGPPQQGYYSQQQQQQQSYYGSSGGSGAHNPSYMPGVAVATNPQAHHQGQPYHQQQHQMMQQQQQYQQTMMQQQQQSTAFTPANRHTIMQHLSVSQMRQLHAQALAEAEAKRTELKLVVTSRYKELVGSSDEVQSMQQLSKQLYEKVQQLPKQLGSVHTIQEDSQTLIQAFFTNEDESTGGTGTGARTTTSTLSSTSTSTRPKTLQQLIHQYIVANFSKKIAVSGGGTPKKKSGSSTSSSSSSSSSYKLQAVQFLRQRLLMLPRRIHRALFEENPHIAALALVELMTWIALLSASSSTSSDVEEKAVVVKLECSSYPLAHALTVLDPTEYHKYIEPVLQVTAVEETKENEDSGADMEQVRISKEHSRQVQLLLTQVQMTYMQLLMIPQKTIRMANGIVKAVPKLFSSTKKMTNHGSSSNIRHQLSATTSGALIALALLDPSYKQPTTQSGGSGGLVRRVVSPTLLLDLYYDSKSKLLSKLLDDIEREQRHNEGDPSSPPPPQANEVGSSSIGAGGGRTNTGNDDDDDDDDDRLLQQLQTIVRVIQVDVVMLSYDIFLQTLPNTGGIPMELQGKIVKAKCSRFLAAHLPLVHHRLKTILSSIHTAGYLAKIRQALYQQTNSFDTEYEKHVWTNAVSNVVDLRVVLHTKDTTGTTSGGSIATPPPSGGTRSWIGSSSAAASTSNTSGSSTTTAGPTFSLWSILFSQTFDSLVENLLRHSCVSLHNNLLSTLLRSLSLAPRPLGRIRAHEAHRNCATIVATLDESLLRLSEDAWKLVHSEERHVSSVALRQSLFVQTCDTLARLLCQLRWLVEASAPVTSSSLDGSSSLKRKALTPEDDDAAITKYIVGRLCFLLKYRLHSLRKLLDPTSAPWYDGRAVASGAGGGGGTTATAVATSGMITMDELKSAFEIADDDDDGVLSLEEAAECLEAAFSGSTFNASHVLKTMKQMSSVVRGGSAMMTPVGGTNATATVMNGVGSDGARKLNVEDGTSTNMLSNGGGGGGLASAPSSTGVLGASTSATEGRVTVTLEELALLTARGVRYETTSSSSYTTSTSSTTMRSTFGGLFGRRQQQQQSSSMSNGDEQPHLLENPTLTTIQKCLDSILETCWKGWANFTLSPASLSLHSNFTKFRHDWTNLSLEEWMRLRDMIVLPTTMDEEHHNNSDIDVNSNKRSMLPKTVSPFVTSFLLKVSMEFHKAVCPNDFLLPVTTINEARALGVVSSSYEGTTTNNVHHLPPSLATLMRRALWKSASHTICSLYCHQVMEQELGSSILKKCSLPCQLQIMLDLSFLQRCMVLGSSSLRLMSRTTTTSNDDDDFEDAGSTDESDPMQQLEDASTELSIHCSTALTDEDIKQHFTRKERAVLASNSMLLSSLFATSTFSLLLSSSDDGSTGATNTSNGVTAAEVLDDLAAQEEEEEGADPHRRNTKATLGSFSGNTNIMVPVTTLDSNNVRFTMLPVQSDRQLNDLMLRAQQQKTTSSSSAAKSTSSSSSSATGGAQSGSSKMATDLFGAPRSGPGFGFFQSMTTKWKK